MSITYSRQAARYINALDAPTKQRIKKGIEKIPGGNIKPLKGYTDGRKRLKIGKYRVVFKQADDDTVDVITIGARGDVYK
jgi:mRNA interferase RelE/StbE